ncbi:MAG TPA: M56 family metallopeptidase [Steroidobacteraceae bacterium]|nr:M56 family metallopeptidase [Steroidobacteraceae bacterium]
MNSPALLGLVLLASFALLSLFLSALTALWWRATASRPDLGSLDLLCLRLLPATGALLLVLTVVLPAFLRYEPRDEREAAGPVLWALAAFAVACLAHGIWRGARACGAARALLARCRNGAPYDAGDGQRVQLLNAAEPLVAVIGAWRPHVVASESVRTACSAEEFRAVLAHEAAHLAARDNLKLLLLLAAPDVLAWTPLAGSLTSRWRAAVEQEADQRATGTDRERRLALASALLKVARLVRGHEAGRPALGMPVAADDVAGRVRGLLAPPARPLRARLPLALAIGALLVPLLALPGHPLLHELIERLVEFGR